MTEPIELSGSYKMKWRDYSKITDTKFYYLMTKIE